MLLQVSVFRNEYVAEREDKKAVMEQHVRLSNTVLSSVETKGNTAIYTINYVYTHIPTWPWMNGRGVS